MFMKALMATIGAGAVTFYAVAALAWFYSVSDFKGMAIFPFMVGVALTVVDAAIWAAWTYL